MRQIFIKTEMYKRISFSFGLFLCFQPGMVITEESGGYIHYANLNRKCMPFYNCGPGKEILPCNVEHTADICHDCVEGLVQPEVVSSTGNTSENRCFKPIGQCLADDITYRRHENPHAFCDSMKGCKCDTSRCYYGDSCLCSLKRYGCGVNHELTETGGCVKCKHGYEKSDNESCGPCLKIPREVKTPSTTTTAKKTTTSVPSLVLAGPIELVAESTRPPSNVTDPNKPSEQSSVLIILIVVLSVLVIALIVILVIVYHFRGKSTFCKNEGSQSQDSPSNDQGERGVLLENNQAVNLINEQEIPGENASSKNPLDDKRTSINREKVTMNSNSNSSSISPNVTRSSDQNSSVTSNCQDTMTSYHDRKSSANLELEEMKPTASIAVQCEILKSIQSQQKRNHSNENIDTSQNSCSYLGDKEKKPTSKHCGTEYTGFPNSFSMVRNDHQQCPTPYTRCHTKESIQTQESKDCSYLKTDEEPSKFLTEEMTSALEEYNFKTAEPVNFLINDADSGIQTD